jgi:hypothetical protein
VHAIVRDPPATVGDLAKALGLRIEELVPHGMFSMGSILGPGVSAEYEWDMYHEAPVERLGALAARRLSSYRITLTEELEHALRERFGEPEHVQGRRRYGPFFAGETELEWYASKPDWARPGVNLQALLDRIAEAETPGPIALDQPVPALALARALGCQTPTARTVDVHMSSSRMEPLRHGKWELIATLAGAPGGADVPGENPPAAGHAYVGEDAIILSLELAPAQG